ncbi:MAG TPA: RES family NAD+ phosphorylase [Acidobacteriaceae bacterium]|jgi:hypothetical protein
MTKKDPPGDLPLPTIDLDARAPIVKLHHGPFYRIYRTTHPDPMFFGRTGNYRFDSATGDCGVLYAAPELDGAWVETFMQELGRTTVSLKELSERPVAIINTKRPLNFIDLFARGGQMRLGLDGRICTGSYTVSQAWSDALRKHPVEPDGILFPSRHELGVASCAIFEAARTELTWTRWGTLNEPHLAAELARLLKMGDVGYVI